MNITIQQTDLQIYPKKIKKPLTTYIKILIVIEKYLKLLIQIINHCFRKKHKKLMKCREMVSFIVLINQKKCKIF